ncbi:MAG: NAD(P)/FAD-dependent oxidoreductase [Oscillospiraceae bacterium]
MRTVAVIGAGASGMTAALTAARAGCRVILFERQARVGRKLMATGNGRCNLTNLGAAPKNYHGGRQDFAAPALAAFPPSATLQFFRELGLLTVTEEGGRVYPLSNSANSVADVLRYALDAAGVELMAPAPARGIRRSGKGFVITTDEKELPADAVIIACGGMAGEKLGGVKDGYDLLMSLGHSRTALRPALVQITTDNTYPRALKGIKADTRLTLLSDGGTPATAEGELLFTESGVSGPAAFDLSRAVAAAGDAKLTISADFLREYTEGEVFLLLCARRAAAGALPTSEILTGALHNRLGRMVVKYAGLPADTPLAELGDASLHALAAACKSFLLPVRGTEGFANAQVTAGGIKTTEFDAETLQSRLVPSLFACGEVLDVDGDCGGYNLQWAWASGRLAGKLGL